MLRYLDYIFPASAANAVATIQAKPGVAAGLVPAGLPYFLNGTVARSNKVSFITQGYSRNISLTVAVTDYTATNFTIVGMQNGVAITEVLAGPHNNTVYSVNIFDTISSITASTDTLNCTIGTGWLGFFHLIEINNLRKNVNYSLSLESSTNVSAPTDRRIPTVVYTTVNDIYNNGSTFKDIVANNVSTLYVVKASSQLTQYSIQYPYTSSLSIPAGAPPLPLLTKYYLIALNGTTDTADSAMKLIFTQV